MDPQVQASIKQAVADGMREALTDRQLLDEFWAVALDALRVQAQQKTGRWLWSFVGRWLVVMALVAGALKVGGIDLAVKVWKAISS